MPLADIVCIISGKLKNGVTVGGSTFAIFTLGLFIPMSESIGASVGLVSGVAVCTWMYIGRNVAGTPTQILEKANKLDVSYEACIYPNGTSPIVQPPDGIDAVF